MTKNKKHLCPTAFRKGDIVVSEDRKFRLIMDIIEGDNGCSSYKYLHLNDQKFKPCVGEEIKIKKLDTGIQPTSVVEQYFHLYRLK